MRVIAGRARGTSLIAPEGTGTRPTTDRTKETLFNVLMPDIPDCIFLDLFSGSGAIAIEALSRGAKEAHLVEKDKKAVACIRQNLKKTHMDSGEASVYTQDYAIVLEQFYLEKKQFDIVFMDIRMPVMNGLEAVHEIRNMNREDAKTLPVIAMSANAFSDDIERSLKAGMNAHVSKPLDAQMMIQAINENRLR